MTNDLTWLMDKLRGMPGVQHALLLSTDGLVRAADSTLDRDRADSMAASACGLLATSGQMTTIFGFDTPVYTVTVDAHPHHLLVMGAGAGSALAVLADMSGPSVDLGAVGAQMTEMVQRIPDHLGTPSRHRKETGTLQ